MKAEERVETLVNLGLTSAQARVYLALIRAGSATAKTLSKATLITQQDIYRIMPSLHKTGLAERLLTKPVTFRATSAEDGIQLLIKRKKIEANRSIKQGQKLAEYVKNDCTDKTQSVHEDEIHFMLISGKETIMMKLMEALDTAQVSLDVVTSKNRFSPAISYFSAGYKKAIERGVKIRIATEKHIVQKSTLNAIEKLKKPECFEVRCFDGAPEAIVSIRDGNQAFVTLSPTANMAGTEGLWSNNASFIALTKHYFEDMWKKATEIP